MQDVLVGELRPRPQLGAEVALVPRGLAEVEQEQARAIGLALGECARVVSRLALEVALAPRRHVPSRHGLGRAALERGLRRRGLLGRGDLEASGRLGGVARGVGGLDAERVAAVLERGRWAIAAVAGARREARLAGGDRARQRRRWMR